MSYHLNNVLGRALTALAGLFVAGGLALAQYRTITGTVLDDYGEPLIGASVTAEGVTPPLGVITDLDGHYEISVPAGVSQLRFSFIGQEDALETIGSRSVINVTLASANIALNATVVTAMGIKKEEKSLSYNVQQTKLESVSPVGSFVNSLNGKVAGVSINQSSTGVGGASRIVMRGSKSISNNNNALYVIDGIPMQSLRGTQPEGVYAGAGQTGDVLGSLNQEDIESISVLSGPSAAALYGANAANGVIIITTKKGSANQAPKVTYSGSMTISTRKKSVEVLNGDEYRSLINSLFPADDPAVLAMGTANTDWQSQIYRTALGQDHNITLTGAVKSLPYRVSVGYTGEQGILKTSDLRIYLLRKAMICWAIQLQSP